MKLNKKIAMYKISIRTKLLIGFSGIFFVMFLMLNILNHYFIDDFFVYQNQLTMKKSIEKVSNNINPSDYRRFENELKRAVGGDISFYDGDFNQIIPSPQPSKFMLTEDVFIEIIQEVQESSEKRAYTVMGNESDFRFKEMIYIKQLDDDTYLVVNKGLGFVNELQHIIVLFLSFASIFVYSISFILIFIYSNRFTRPIIEIKKGAERITHFDFSEIKIKKPNDEIGDLVTSINTMAVNLSKNIETINKTNFLLEKELSKEKSLEEMRRRFVLDVSHELKNPISMIIGFAEGIFKDIPKTQEDKKYYAQVIIEEGKRMNAIVKDLLDISINASGVVTLNRENVDLASLIYETVERYTVIKNKKNIELIFDIKSHLNIKGDIGRLTQVIINLLDNAFKHAEIGGQIKIELFEKQANAEIIVSNTGNLIPEEELGNIWDSFYQVDTYTEGSGLGLAIVKSIVEFHEGKVEVYVEQQMNHFKIALPL